MLGHYLYFLSYFNRSIFTLVSGFLAKWNKASLKKVDRSKGELIMGVWINLLYPLLIWLCIKFRYHSPLELLFGVVANSIEPMLYFFDNFGSGNLNLVQLPIEVKLSELSMSYFSGTFDHHLMKQWQYTIIILDLIMAGVKGFLWLALTSEGNKAFTLLYSFAFGLTLFMFSKEYLELYVDLSKI